MIIPVKYKLGGPLIGTVRFKPASKLRLFHNAITTKEYQHSLNAPESIFDEDLERDEIVGNWRRICDPYAIVSQIMEEGKESTDTISFNDIQYISEVSGCEMNDVHKTHSTMIERVRNINVGASDIEIIESACALFELEWFKPLMKNIFSKYNVLVDVENVFSGFNRRLACGNDQSCPQCELPLDSEAWRRGCDLCDPIHTLYSPSTIHLHRNGRVHTGLFVQTKEERSIHQREKIHESFRIRAPILSQISTLQHQKIVATVFHLLGMNGLLWEEPPKSIADIWENHPNEDPVAQMKKTIEELLDNNKGWGRENYVDYSNRVDQLRDNLRTSKIITIYGEGGLGKTELVYQTLKRSLDDENQTLRYDYLLPFTFKGKLQGEFDITSPNFRSGANQKGWKAVPEFFTMVTELAKYESKDLGDETQHDVWFNKAVEFLINKNVWLIIDNHEVDQDTESLDKLLTKFVNHQNIQQSNTRIIITTRGTRVAKGSMGVPITALQPTEMAELAKNKAIWLARRSDNADIRFPLQTQTDKHWKSVETFMSSKLKTRRHDRAAGHPYVVFIAVWVHMFHEDAKETFAGTLESIIDSYVNSSEANEKDFMSSLMAYIIGFSFNYMKTAERKEDADKLLKLTQYERISRDNLIDIFDTDWKVFITELESLEILVEAGLDQDTEEWEFRTEYHKVQLTNYITQKHNLQKPSAKWKWWHDRIKSIALDKKLSLPTLKIIGVEEEKSEDKHRANLDEAKEILERFEDWSSEDAMAAINIVSHFGKVLSEIGEENNFLLPPTNSRADFRVALVSFLYETVSMGIESLADFLGKHENEVPLNLFKRTIRLLTNTSEIYPGIFRKYVELVDAGSKWESVELEVLVGLKSLPEEEVEKIVTGEITGHLISVLLEIPAFVPTPTKHSLESIRRLWNLGKRCGLPAKNFLKTGLLQMKLVGSFEESVNIINYLAKNIDLEEGIRVPTLVDEDMENFGSFLVQNRDYITENDDVQRLIHIVKQCTGDDTTLFRSQTMTVTVSNPGPVILGQDIEFDTNSLIHNIINSTEFKPPNNVILVAKVLPYSKENGVLYSLLEEVVEVREQNSITKEKHPHEDWRPVEDVPVEEMREILNAIDFHSIPGAVLFGQELKEALRHREIQHHGKVWKRWKIQHYPRYNGSNKPKPIQDIVDHLMEGKWKVETGLGEDIKVRRTTAIDKALETWLNRPKRSYPIPKPKSRVAEIISPHPKSKTPPALRRRKPSSTLSSSRPLCCGCKGRNSLRTHAPGKLYCISCEHVIDESTGECLTPNCKICGNMM